VAEVDETLFADGTVDREVELEHADPEVALAAFRRVAAVVGLALEPAHESKHRRAREHCGAMPPPVPGEEGSGP